MLGTKADLSHSCSAAILSYPAISLHVVLNLGCTLELPGDIKKILMLSQHPRFVQSESLVDGKPGLNRLSSFPGDSNMQPGWR